MAQPPQPPAPRTTPPLASESRVPEEKVYAALAQGNILQSDWEPCPIRLDGLDIINDSGLTFHLLIDDSIGRVERNEHGVSLRVADCVLLLDRTRGRFLTVPLNTPVRAVSGSELVLPRRTLRSSLGEERAEQIGWLGGHGAFLGATTPR